MVSFRFAVKFSDVDHSLVGILESCSYAVRNPGVLLSAAVCHRSAMLVAPSTERCELSSAVRGYASAFVSDFQDQIALMTRSTLWTAESITLDEKYIIQQFPCFLVAGKIPDSKNLHVYQIFKLLGKYHLHLSPASSNMQALIALYFFHAVAISAGPVHTRQPHQVTFALSNDQTGAYAGATFLADGTDKKIGNLFAGTSVGAGGKVQASSGQLTAFPQTISCILKNNGAAITTLTAQHTYVDLDGNPRISIPVNLDGASINCRA